MSFFKPTEVESINCSKCQFKTPKNKEKVICKHDQHLLLSKVSNPNLPIVLVLLTTPVSNMYLEHTAEVMLRYGIPNYDIYSALRCEVKSFDNITLQSVFKSCKSNYDLGKYATVITFDNAFMQLIGSSDFKGWFEFTEINFNQTYIYTPIYNNPGIKIFPLPPVYEYVKEYNKLKLVEYIKHTKSDSFEGLFIDHQMRQVKDTLQNPNRKRIPKVNTIVVDNPNEWLRERINSDTPGIVISFDTETNSLDHYIPDFIITEIIVSYDGKTSYILEYEKVDKGLFDSYISKKLLIGANIKYDIKGCWRLGHDRNVFHIKDDVITLYHCLNTVADRIGLKVQSWFIGFGGYDKELDDYKDKYKHILYNHHGQLDYSKIPKNIRHKYAGYDGIVTYKIRDWLYDNPQKSIIQAYQEKIVPSFDTFIDMEKFGIPFDRKEALEINKRIYQEMKVLNRDIKSYFMTEFVKKGLDVQAHLKDFDVSSDDKLRKVISMLGWPQYDTTDTGQLSVGENNLVYWKNDGYGDVVDKILEYRGKASLSQTHLTGWSNHVSLYDNVVHPNINTARADTLRDTHTEPNSGNIPAHGQSAKIIRPLFFKDKIIFEFDYSGFQLRIMALYSQDPTMIKTFQNEGDIHSETGAFIFHKNMDVNEFRKFAKEEIEPYDRNRFKSKTLNFSLVFSSEYFVLIAPIKREWSDVDIQSYFEDNKDSILESDYVYTKGDTPEINILATVCKIIWTKFFQKYPKVYEYIKSQHNISKQGWVDGYFGTRRHLPYLMVNGEYTNKGKYNSLLNVSVNSDIQTFEALCMKPAMAQIRKEFIDLNLWGDIVQLNVTTHDSLTGSMPSDREDLIPTVADVMMRNMEIRDRSKYPIDFTVESAFYKVWKDKNSVIAKFG